MKVKCPVCRRETEWEGNLFRPFCSERCKIRDLGNWASGDYSIKGEKVEDDEEEKDPTFH